MILEVVMAPVNGRGDGHKARNYANDDGGGGGGGGGGAGRYVSIETKTKFFLVSMEQLWPI